VDVPLTSTFMLSTKAGQEAYVEPEIESGGYDFKVKVGKPKDTDVANNGTKLARGANFQCLMSRTPMESDYIKSEGVAGRMGARLMATVAAGDRGRVYLSPTREMETIARLAKPSWVPEGSFVEDARAFTPCLYGIREWRHLFTSRQLVALTTFSELVNEARERVKRDSTASGLSEDGRALADGGTGAAAYGDAVAVYLAFAVDKAANMWSALCFWMNDRGAMRETFARQLLPMVWDFAEANPLSSSGGNFNHFLDKIAMAVDTMPANSRGNAATADAAVQVTSQGKCISTDPPYYDNVPYADLSDFFYVWLRRSLKVVFPELFATLAVPKAEELVVTSYRHGGKRMAEVFFMDGMTGAMSQLAEQGHSAYPITIYYAFKQSESGGVDGTASTGWERFLDAVIRAGLAVSGTWPVRTEQAAALKSEMNALASSIILVCRKRPADAPTATRREFVTALKAELPAALANLQRGNIAPVDLAQAAIGPGMAVYTRYAKVLDAEGKPVTVREALALINQTLDEALAEQEGDFDADSRWALTWFEQSGFAEGEYGVAEQLSKSKNTSVAGMVEAGILASHRGRVRLLRPEELPATWDPATDTRLTVWEMVHHLIRVLQSGGESAAAELAAKLGSKAEVARELAYRLYALCERKKRAPEAMAYNGLVQSWPEILRLARVGGKPSALEGNLFE
jgi:putative DNA methylase